MVTLQRSFFFRTAFSPRNRARSPYFLLENALVALVDVAAAWISPVPRTLFAGSATPFLPDLRSERRSCRRVRSNLLADGCRNCAVAVLSTVIAPAARLACSGRRVLLRFAFLALFGENFAIGLFCSENFTSGLWCSLSPSFSLHSRSLSVLPSTTRIWKRKFGPL